MGRRVPMVGRETEADRQQCKQDREDAWAKSPYRYLTGAGVKVVVRDDD